MEITVFSIAEDFQNHRNYPWKRNQIDDMGSWREGSTTAGRK